MEREEKFSIDAPQKRNRVSKGVGEVLLMTAVFVDFGPQFLFGTLPFFIPVFGPFIAASFNAGIVLMASSGFALWFKLLGVSVFEGRVLKKLALLAFGSLFELVLGIIPGYTLMVFFVIREARREDKEYNERIEKEASAQAEGFTKNVRLQNKAV